MDPPLQGGVGSSRSSGGGSGIAELHLHPGEFDDVVVAQRMRGRTEVVPVDRGKSFTFDVRDEIAGGPARDHRDLMAWPADRRQCFHQRELAPAVCAGEYLDRRNRRLARVFGAAGLAHLDRGGSRTVELTPQWLRRVDIDFSIRGRAVCEKLEPVLADLDDVAALEQMLLDRLPVDGRAVGRAEILEIDVGAVDKHDRVLAADGEVV